MRRLAGFLFCILSILLILTANNAFPQSWKSGKITFWSCDWSVPGGKWQWSIMNVDGSDMTKLMDYPFQVGNHQYLASGFILSPDCKKAAVVISVSVFLSVAPAENNFDFYSIGDSRKCHQKK